MRTQRRVKKRCETCGHVAALPARQRHCHRPRFGRGSYACWGNLVEVVRQPKAAPDAVPVWVLSEDADHARFEKARAAAFKEFDHVNDKLVDLTREMAKLGQQIGRWQRRRKRAEKRCQMTFDEYQAAKTARLGRVAARVERTRTRAIALPE